MYITPDKSYYHFSTLHLVALSSSNYKTDGKTHALVSLNCSGSEDHLKECPHHALLEYVDCFDIATVFCKGMWRHNYMEVGKGMQSAAFFSRYITAAF